MANTEGMAEYAPDFDEWCDLFVRAGSTMPPAELHGLLTGKLAGGSQITEHQWLHEVASFMDTPKNIDPADQARWIEIYRYMAWSLQDDDYSYHLLLPDDDNDIEIRLEAVSQWCNGFLAGFALAEHDVESEAVRAALEDVAAIAQVGLGDDERDDHLQVESDYMEVTEYLKLVALNVYAECHLEDDAEADDKSAMASNVYDFANKNKTIH